MSGNVITQGWAARAPLGPVTSGYVAAAAVPALAPPQAPPAGRAAGRARWPAARSLTVPLWQAAPTIPSQTG